MATQEVRRTAGRVTSLLTNEQLARLERMRIQSSRRFTNRSSGDHRSRGGGRSIEFKDYRDYVSGDDIRFLDWNIFARLQRPFVKLFHDEEELHVVLLLDASTSMTFEGKLERARQLAAAFATMGLLGGERVSAHVFDGRESKVRSLRAIRGRRGLVPLFQFLEKVEGGGDRPLEEGVETMLRTHHGRGVMIVLSDFLTAGDLRRAFNRAHGCGLEVFGLQVLGPSEIRPEMTRDLRLIDSETNDHVEITGFDDLLPIYHEYRRSFQHRLQQLCQQRSGRYLAVDSGESFAETLFDTLRRRGWVR